MGIANRARTLKKRILRFGYSNDTRLYVLRIASDGPHHPEKTSTMCRKSFSAASPLTCAHASSLSISVVAGPSSPLGAMAAQRLVVGYEYSVCKGI